MSKTTPKKATKKQMSALRIICIVALILCVFVFVMYSGSEDYKLINAHTAENITDLNDKLEIGTDIVQFDELVIVDKYAVYGSVENEDDVDQAYYLAEFWNNEKPYYASLCCDVDSDIYNTVEQYVNDDNQLIGDMIIPVCAKYRSNSEKGKEFYEEAKARYDEVLNEDVTDSGLQLEYAFDNASQLDEYAKTQKKSSSKIRYRALELFFVCACGIGITSINISKIKKREAEASSAELNSEN